MFRSVPREVLEEREDARIFREHPSSTKYSPNVGYIQPRLLKNVDFGPKGEDETRKRIDELRQKIEHRIVCSKGATSCFSSVKRVKEHAKDFVRETFVRLVLLTERRKAHRKGTISTEPTEEPTMEEDVGTLKKNKFYVSPFSKSLGPDQYKGHTATRITLEALAKQAKSPNNNPTYHQIVKGQVEQVANLRNIFRKKNLRSKMAVKELLSVKLNNNLDKFQSN